MDPIGQLTSDRMAAREAGDPWAALCCVGTTDDQGLVSMRTLVLREVDGKLALFLNATSPKWRQIERVEAISLLIYLPSQEVQFRLRVTPSAIPKSTVDASWGYRPDMPKKLDWFYSDQAQSTAVDPNELAKRLAGDVPTPKSAPATAMGLYLEPVEIERLQLSEDIHVRQLYQMSADGTWSLTHLVP